MVSIVQQERFSGPIAHPKHLREYDEICPGAADRIIKMAESEISHNQEMQSRALHADIEDTKSGRRYGFAALAMLIGCALLSSYFGKDTLSYLFLGAAAMGVIGRFIQGRRQNNGDQSE